MQAMQQTTYHTDLAYTFANEVILGIPMAYWVAAAFTAIHLGLFVLAVKCFPRRNTF